VLSANVQKSAKPFPYIVIRIWALSPHTGRQVRELLGGVPERVKLGVFLDLEVRSIFRRAIKSNGAFHFDVCARCIEIEKRDAVAEYVVNLRNASRLGRNWEAERRSRGPQGWRQTPADCSAKARMALTFFAARERVLGRCCPRPTLRRSACGDRPRVYPSGMPAGFF
jgi:hypothetical protein